MENYELKDNYARKINYLRLSVTDRCNLHCLYCTPKEGRATLGHNDILRYEEILRVVRISTTLGIQKVRITGGEPLVRKGLTNFISLLTKIEGLKDIGLTTNGTLLSQYAEELYKSGLKRINVSLDSLREDKYKFITGGGEIKEVLEGLKEAQKVGFSPIKINVVAINGFNDDEILDFASLSLSFPYEVRFIELMPFNDSWGGQYLPCTVIKEKIESAMELEPLRSEPNPANGPARMYKLKNGEGRIGFISPMSAHFCNECNRLRLTADGHLRSCLFSDEETDLKGKLREGCSDEALRSLIVEAVKNKAQKGVPQGKARQKNCQRQMNSIGG